MPTVALDFDGVLSAYNGDPTLPPGPPVAQAKNFVEQLRKKGLEVVIFSSREQDKIRQWLEEFGFPPLQIFYKPPILALIDDRAVRFQGSFEGLNREIWQPPWWQNKEDRKRKTDTKR
jgi:predicted HAD superfamily phosphohydrolase YqeG